MKRLFVLIAVLFTLCLCACNQEKEGYTVTFDTEGGTSIKSQVVELGDYVDEPNKPKKPGYEFLGWYTDDGNLWPFEFSSPAEDLTLNARWGIETYTITYVGAKGDVTSYTINDQFDLADGTVVGPYDEFEGWYLDKELTKPITKIEAGTAKDLTLYAKVSGSELAFTLLGDSRYQVASSLMKVTNVIVPESYKGLPVTRINDGAFKNRTSLESISLPSTITSIGQSAFEGCTSLTTITIPEKVLFLGTGCFNSCINLSSITFAGDEIESMGSAVFENCVSLENITLPSKLYVISSNTFKGCTALDGIVIPENVTQIYGSAFKDCIALTKIVIPKKVTAIHESAFEGCKTLKSLRIDGNVTEIGRRAFGSCYLLEQINLPSSLEYIGVEAFCWSNIRNVWIPDGAIIDANAFYGCNQLKNVRLPSDLTTISYGAFGGCSGLEQITLPDTLLSIEQKAFYSSGIISLEIPNSVVVIGDSAFEDCRGLESVELSDSLKVIGNSAFELCTSIKTISLPMGLTTIGNRAFYNCWSLKSVEVPSSVTSIGQNALPEIPEDLIADEWDTLEAMPPQPEN